MSQRHATDETTGGDEPASESAPSERLDRIWRRAYQAKDKRDLQDLYADWAASYDEDHEAIGFFGHIRAAEVASRYISFPDVAPVLDAGAGTGAAGVALAAQGVRNITAVDLSAEMLEVADQKGVYRDLVQADLGLPLDAFPVDHFNAAILVGVFSFGQAPAHALDEIVRVVEPGGVVVFTMRTDFFEQDAMGVRSRMEALEREGDWQLVELTEPEPYLPKKDPTAEFRVWCYRVQPSKQPEAADDFADAVRRAFSSESRVKRLDHCHIWDSMASRLYNRYIECPEYYLNDCEEEILRSHADQMVGSERLIVELGCGSAKKISHVLDAAVKARPGTVLSYTPIDLSSGALHNTRAEIEARFGGQIEVDPRQGHFDDALHTIPGDAAKVMFFFGGSLGNIESVSDTVAFLNALKERMTPRDRLIVGIDLDKDPEVLRKAYQAGPRSLTFFLNMVRRINNALDANLDLLAFEQGSTYDEDEPYHGIQNRCVNLKLTTERDQKVFIAKLNMEVDLKVGDAIQVGTSRKFRLDDVGCLAELAGLRLARRWLDERKYFCLAELVRP